MRCWSTSRSAAPGSAWSRTARAAGSCSRARRRSRTYVDVAAQHPARRRRGGAARDHLHGRRCARRARARPPRCRVDLTTAGAEFGGPGDDILLGEPGVNDAIAGRRGDDQLFGLSGDDVLDGGLGDDQLFGDDTLAAASDGDDVLIGGPGADLLVGGGGADAHVFFTLTERGDTIRGFDATAGDTLDFSGLFQGAASIRARSTPSCASMRPAATSW